MSTSKSSKWGSNWTIEKLNAFKKYVEAYLIIMDIHKNKYGWKTLYFDGFAGNGNCNRDNKMEEANASLLFDFGIDITETKVYKGAAERVLSIKKKFDYYYFIDLDGESLKKLQICILKDCRKFGSTLPKRLWL